MAQQFGPTLWQSILIALRVIWRVVRQVFHETTGVFFGLFSIYGAIAAYREWKYHPTFWPLIIAFAGVYTAMMAAFAFFAFRRARRIR
jgi:membrane associated rhomboid family serine protease